MEKKKFIIKPSPDPFGFQIQEENHDEREWPIHRVYAQQESREYRIYQHITINKGPRHSIGCEDITKVIEAEGISKRNEAEHFMISILARFVENHPDLLGLNEPTKLEVLDEKQEILYGSRVYYPERKIITIAKR
ncbi:MAG: hypothetical protein AABW79_03890 [Nanoarchaeota archaeon]